MNRKRSKHRKFNKGKRTEEKVHCEEYIVHIKVTEKVLRQSCLDYTNVILQTSLNKRNSKPFWKYIKSKKKMKILYFIFTSHI